MSHARPPRRTQRPASAAWRQVPRPVAPAPRPAFRLTWASAEGDPQSHEAAIGKVARFGDAPRVGRVKDVIFERETGDVLAYEVDPGDGTACFVNADMLERETPCTLHFAGSSPTPFGGDDDENEFMILEHLPEADGQRPLR